jgi:hypothetical protein
VLSSRTGFYQAEYKSFKGHVHQRDWWGTQACNSFDVDVFVVIYRKGRRYCCANSLQVGWNVAGARTGYEMIASELIVQLFELIVRQRLSLVDVVCWSELGLVPISGLISKVPIELRGIIGIRDYDKARLTFFRALSIIAESFVKGRSDVGFRVFEVWGKVHLIIGICRKQDTIRQHPSHINRSFYAFSVTHL